MQSFKFVYLILGETSEESKLDFSEDEEMLIIRMYNLVGKRLFRALISKFLQLNSLLSFPCLKKKKKVKKASSKLNSNYYDQVASDCWKDPRKNG